MKREFVKTSNARLFRSAVASALARGSLESSMIKVTGRAGDGKTHTLQNWAAEAGAVMLTGQVDWTPRRLLLDLAEKLGLDATAGFERRITPFVALKRISIIVDEAGFALQNNAACLEKLRGITDASSTLLILVFMPHDVTRLEGNPRFKQLNDRMPHQCDFRKSTLDDVAMAVAQLCEYPIAPCLVQHLHEVSDGCMRIVMNGIARLEGEARVREAASATAAPAPMTLASVKGLDLFKGLGRTLRRGVGA